ncbi:MAG: hypothetical protein BYD32DRAFT_148561 [Podila humilis]|nr:MAG: hypothetical protein BYD32DRAFT_148561 [Podila humilis]
MSKRGERERERERRAEAEIAMFLNVNVVVLILLVVFLVRFLLILLSLVFLQGLSVSLHCSHCSRDLDWRWFLCLFCLPWLCLSLYMHASLLRLSFALHSCCVVVLADIFVRTPGCVSFLLKARPSFLQT